jgi:hypothetical protein
MERYFRMPYMPWEGMVCRLKRITCTEQFKKGGQGCPSYNPQYAFSE